MRKLIGCLLTACLAAPACRDTGGPNSSVALDVVRTGGPLVSQLAEGPDVRCQLRVEATLAGERGVRWVDAMFRWHLGTDTTAAFDSSYIPTVELQGLWGETLDRNAADVALWEVWAGNPFTLELEFRYTVSGRQGSAVAFIDCGTAALDDAPPPNVTISNLQLPAVLEPGRAVSFDVDITAPGGLWETIVVMSGGCDLVYRLPAQLETTRHHDLSILLPATCQLGQHASIGVAAVDAGLRSTSVPVGVVGPITDQTAPQIGAIMFPSPAGGGPATSTLAGQFYTGDSLHVVVVASDNHSMRWLAWDVMPVGIHDSMALLGHDASATIRIPVTAAWVGADQQLRLRARDVSGQASNTLQSQGAITVAMTEERPMVCRTISGFLRDVVFDVGRGRMYAVLGNVNQVAVLNSGTLNESKRVRLHGLPTDADITPSGDTLIVMLFRPGLDVIDLATLPDTAERIAVPIDTTAAFTEGVHVRALTNGRWYSTFSGDTQTVNTLLETDPATWTHRRRPEPGNGTHIGLALGRSGDASVLVMGGGSVFQRFDAGTDAFGPVRSAATGAFRPRVDHDGTVISISADLYGPNLDFLRRLEGTWGGGYTNDVSPDGLYHYRLEGWAVLKARVSDGEVETRTPLNTLWDWDVLRVSPDGQMLVVGDGTTNGLSMMCRMLLQ